MLKEKFMAFIAASFFISSHVQAFTENNFYYFNPNAYNALSGPEEVHSILTSIPETRTYIDRSLDEAKDAGIDLGFRLLHRHGLVSQNECMVEHFESRNQRPSLVTTQEVRGSSEYFPASWIIQNGCMQVFEFSTDKKVHENLSLILDNIDVYSSIVEILRKQGLDRVLAPAILNRSSEVFFGTEEGLMLEKTTNNPFESVIMKSQTATLNDPNVIQTVWGHPIKHGCFNMAGCYSQYSVNIHLYQVHHI